MNRVLSHLIANDGPETKGEASAVVSHKVARCLWNTTFDDQAGAHALQNTLSHWSNSELNGLLERAFQHFCPAGQTWRISKLELDLGEILLDDLSTELPKRVQAALYEQLSRLLPQSERKSLASGAVTANLTADSHAQIIDNRHTLNEVIAYFLESGALPWWYNGTHSLHSILLQQLEQTPQQIAAILRSVAQSESVRKRIAWQYENPTLHKIVQVLEPQDHVTIIALTQHLQYMQVKTQKPTSDRSGFARQSWFWVFTHLLVERGSLFNTVAFVESTIRQMAHAYQLDFAQLLQQLVNAAQSLKTQGGTLPQFIQALLRVQQNNPTASLAESTAKHSASNSVVPITPSLTSDNSPTLNQVIAYFLETGNLPGWYSGTQSQDAILLQQLEQTPQQIAAILRAVGQSESVRTRIVRHYENPTLYKIVEVLEPQNYATIIAFTEHLQDTQAKTQQPTSDRSGFARQSWFWVFTHLLVERGSLFNTVAFVESTLRQMAHAYQLDFAQLLQQLLRAAQSLAASGGSKPAFVQALLNIQEKNQAHSTQNTATPSAEVYRQAPKVIGQHYLPAATQMFSIVLHRHPSQWTLLASDVFTAGSTTDTRIKRLLELMQPADFPVVLNTLDALLGGFAVRWTARLLEWQSRKWLPSLSGFDCHHELHGLVLRIVINQRGANFSPAQFLSAFFADLNKRYGVDSQRLATEIESNLLRDSGKNSLSTADASLLKQWLSANQTEQADPGVEPIELKSDIMGMLQQIIVLLRRNGKRVAEEGQGASVSELLAVLIPAHADLLLAMLQQQNDRQRLVQTLLKQRPQLKPWLESLWPSATSIGPEFLRQWQAAIWKSGLWVGEEKALQALLQKTFDLSVLEWTSLKPDKTLQENLDDFLDALVQASCISLQIDVKQLCQQIDLSEAPLWKSALEANRSFVRNALTEKSDIHLEEPRPQQQQTTTVEQLADETQRQRLPTAILGKLCEYFLAHGRPPLWLASSEVLDLPQLIAHLLQRHPQGLAQAIKPIQQRPAALFRLQNALSFKDLLEAVRLTTHSSHGTLTQLADVFQGLARLQFDGVATGLLQAILWQKVLQAWLNGDNQTLNTQALLLALCGELKQRYQIPSEQIESQFKRHEQHFPEDCHVKLSPELTNPQRQARPATAADKAVVMHAAKKISNQTKLDLTMPSKINNAGLVLLQGFIVPYFDRLGLVKDQAFCNEQAQRDAVHALQYLATGLIATEEQHLLLNKVLCGLLPTTPLERGFEMSDADKTTADSLITAAIDYWPAIGSSSVDGFRGNWLVRTGLLNFSEQRWELHVEKRPYDLLLQSAPFSFGLIKLPWMTTPLYVTWPY